MLKRNFVCLAALGGLVAVVVAQPAPNFTTAVPNPGTPADPNTTSAGFINISGATLFEDFFPAAEATNDWIDADGDGFAQFNDPIVGDPNYPAGTDQLARTPACGPFDTYWVVNYRGVGSGNGLAEFVDYQLLGKVPTTFADDFGYFNRFKYSEGGSFFFLGGCNIDDVCQDWDANVPDAQLDRSNSPLCQASIDIGVMDVPTKWFVAAGDPNDGAWNNKPTASGYGYGTRPDLTGKIWTLKSLQRDDGSKAIVSLNTNTAAPDANTIFDSEIAWVPVAFIANAGVNIPQLKVTELHHLFLTGRLPSGEDINAATRDAGSGTRNAIMNSIGLDPAWAQGDGLHPKWSTSPEGYLGSTYKWTNSGGSSRMEDAVTNGRLALGYTGLLSGSKAADHFFRGEVEVIDVMFDDRGGTQYVRPSIHNVLFNGDPDTGYQIGGPETMATRGDPEGVGPAMTNDAAAAYINNITGSVAVFAGGDPNLFFSPAEFLATSFVLTGAVTHFPLPTDPADLQANPRLNTILRDWTDAHAVMDGGDTLGLDYLPPYGSFKNGAGEYPRRNAGAYSDGTIPADGGDYLDIYGVYHAYGTSMPATMRVAFDFDCSGHRDWLDITDMIDAYLDQLNWEADCASAAEPVIPAIIGDANGDGNFDAADVVYFANGLAVDPNMPQGRSTLCRERGFTDVDNAYFAAMGSYFFETVVPTVWASGTAYSAGDARFDVAGAGGLRGADGTIDDNDVAYVQANFGDWSDLEDALYMDLACDMNCDLVVDAADVALITAGLVAIGDMNCDGSVNFGDIDPFVLAITDASGYAAAYPDCNLNNADINDDGFVNFGDIDPFVALITGG